MSKSVSGGTMDGVKEQTVYDLPLTGSNVVEEDQQSGSPLSLKDLVRGSALWYCQLRWIVIATFAAVSLLSFVPGLFASVGWKSPLLWPQVVALVLLVANLGFRLHLRIVRSETENPFPERVNLWTQIVFDLIMVTATVHLAGSVESPVSFSYLFHIILACIFFSRTKSFAVTLIAGSLYITLFILETTGSLSPSSIHASPGLREQMNATVGGSSVTVVGSVASWAIIWYIASYLSTLLRHREHELERANISLRLAQEERMRHMLHTTHELKAPFAAIQANTQLLLKGYCGELPDKAIEIIDKIGDRSRRLTGAIQGMLQLANLQSRSERPVIRSDIDLAELLSWCVNQVTQVAREFGVTIETRIGPATVRGVEDHLKMLFSNLVSNAVIYSHRDGNVLVTCSSSGAEAVVTVADKGIGIPAAKLPQIFEEYYRTTEAVKHNKNSSGLGLAIVRAVAETHRIAVRVESVPDQGTTFTLRLKCPVS